MTTEEINKALYKIVFGFPAVDNPPAETPAETTNDLGIKDSQLTPVASLINQSPKIEGSKISLLLFERSKYVTNEHIPNAPKKIYFGMSEFNLDCFDDFFNPNQSTPMIEEPPKEEAIKYDFTNWKPNTITVDSKTGEGIRNY